MRYFRIAFIFIAITSILIMCKSPENKAPVFTTDTTIANYWNDGKAELNHYELLQERYGEVRKGTADLIFVKEDFVWDKRVKADYNDGTNKNIAPVLKLNATRKFVTGIYPYSIMTSVFSPFSSDDKEMARKVSFSSQEWCGQVYTQLNHAGKQWFVNSHSYFEQEADQQLSLKKILTEDEVFNKIRLTPEGLPSGTTKILPSLTFLRLYHHEIKEYKADFSLSNLDSVQLLTIKYQELDRTVKIKFETAFPNKILGWEEIVIKKGNLLITKATLKNTIKLDYWNHNHLSDSLVRKEYLKN